MVRILLALLILGWAAHDAGAHYNMLIPDQASAKQGDAVRFTYQFGHPYEHELFDAPRPRLLVVVQPDGTRKELTDTLEKVEVDGGGKKVSAYRFQFTPRQRGDFVFVLSTPPIWLEGDEEFVQDTVKVLLHVQAQKGWEADAGEEYRWTPLTRPYGLQPGMVFQARLREKALGPGAIALVEFERYNPVAPAKMPPDEFITRTVRTDPNGVVTGTLTEPGWWALTAAKKGEPLPREGSVRTRKLRTTFWIFVDPRTGR